MADAGGAAAAPPLRVDRLLKPASIAVVGASTNPGAMGSRVLDNLERFAFPGDLHLVSRSRTELRGRPCVPSIDDLPQGVDLAILSVPGEGVKEAVEACVRRGVGAAVVYASGFAEAGEQGAAAQEEIARIAREGGLALLGPNCIGLTNFVDGVPLSFGIQSPRPVTAPALAVVGQSGGLVGAIRLSVTSRDLNVSFTISTGNEAVLAVDDFIDYVLDDPATKVVAVFVEQIRRPQRFLELAAKARALGKPIILLHPGRSAKGREAAQSHTGAVASDYAVMETLARGAGVLVVDSIEDLVDVAELLLRFGAAPTAGPGIITDSGAFKGLSADLCEALDLDLPSLSADTLAGLTAALPDFATPNNPLDVTAIGLSDVEVYGRTAKVMLQDPAIGSLIVCIMPGSAEFGLKVGQATLPFFEGAPKPIVYILLGEGSPVSPELVSLMRGQSVTFSRSPQRVLAALARITAYGRDLARLNAKTALQPVTPPPSPGQGVVAEYLGKGFLAQLGLPTPAGGLARSAEEACAIAARVGYPVAMKAQAAALPHKSDVGGVALNLSRNEAVAQAYDRMLADVLAARPELTLDGVLVEAMAPRGVEMIVSARRDPDWGPVLMVGLGGVWIEALGDVRLMPADLGEAEIVENIQSLKGAKLLQGFRGAPPADVEAVAGVLRTLGGLMQSMPELQEVEINPLVVYPPGEGVLVLDGLLTFSEEHG